MNTIHLDVKGMTCGGCVKRVKETLQAMAGVKTVEVDLASGHVSVSGDLPQVDESLALALTVAGYPAKAGVLGTFKPAAKKSGGCCG